MGAPGITEEQMEQEVTGEATLEKPEVPAEDEVNNG
jgi:hypothetical protein